jgi:hypothetical protein
VPNENFHQNCSPTAINRRIILMNFAQFVHMFIRWKRYDEEDDEEERNLMEKGKFFRECY